MLITEISRYELTTKKIKFKIENVANVLVQSTSIIYDNSEFNCEIGQNAIDSDGVFCDRQFIQYFNSVIAQFWVRFGENQFDKDRKLKVNEKCFCEFLF